MKIGAHESISENYYLALQRGLKDGCECIQIFTKNPRVWESKKITLQESLKFKETAKELNIKPNVSHASYLLNLANSDNKKRNFVIFNLINEIKRAEQLGLMGVIFHPGSNFLREEGINNIINGINTVIEKTKDLKCKIIVENTSGSGNWLGKNFEELKKILNGIKNKKRFGFCFDTCHAYVSGYDLKNNYEKVFNDFDKMIGLKWIKCFHLNDALNELNSKKDRHENIGKGKLGIKTFTKLINDKRFEKTPAYLETPNNNYKKEITLLKSLRK